GSPMAKQKTLPTAVSVDAFLHGVADAQQREDSYRLLALMQEITGEPPRMWGPSIVGFGQYHYVYASGHEGDSCLAGFAPRKNTLVIYLCAGLDQRSASLLKKLGKAKGSKGCLYIKKLADVDLAVLREMIEANVACLQEMSKPAGKKKGKAK